MFKHIVMWKINEDTSDQSKKDSAEVIKSACEQHPPLRAQIYSDEGGINRKGKKGSLSMVLK